MGWSFCDDWKSKADCVAARLSDAKLFGWTVIAHKTTRSGLWYVAIKDSEPFIFFDLMEKHDSWGYKDMSESMHPYYYDCPLSFLDMAPVACQAWRDGVKKYHTDKQIVKNTKVNLKVGQVIKFAKGFSIPEVQVTAIKECKVFGEYQGRVYRVTPRCLVNATIIETKR